MKSLWTPILAVAAAAGLTGCGEQTDGKKAAETNAATTSPMTAPADYLGALDKAQKTAGKVTEVASINQAIQTFKVDHDRFPKDLNELVQEKYLPQVPAAPYGMKLVYDASTGKVKVIRQ